MHFLVIIEVFIIGLVVGSFLNVVILRGEKGERLGGRSRCPHCKRVLSARELIPILSFFFQKGRCRSCRAAISWQYPLVEFGTGVSFAYATWMLLPSFQYPSVYQYIEFFGALVTISASVVILISDLRFQIIPDGAVLVLAIVGIGSAASHGTLVYDAIAAAAGAAFFAAVWGFSGGRWMGLGDAKLAFPAFLLVGYYGVLPTFLFSFWLGGVAAVVLFILGKKGLKSRIPFGPFILAGSALAYIIGEQFLAFTGLGLLL